MGKERLEVQAAALAPILMVPMVNLETLLFKKEGKAKMDRFCTLWR